MSGSGRGGHTVEPASARGKQFWTVENLTSPSTLLIVASALLCAIGLTTIFSASSIEAIEEGRDFWDEFLSQFIYMAVGLVFCVLTVKYCARLLFGRWFWAVWVLTALLLAMTLVMGSESHGATRWLVLGPISMQPSEFAKITIIVAAARQLALWRDGSYDAPNCVLRLALTSLSLCALVFLEKDLGTLLIVGATLVLMWVLAGARPRWVLATIAAGGVLVLIAVLAAPYRFARFSVWFDPYSDYYGDGWQIVHGIYAVASGGFWGVGLGNSTQKYSWLPEAENDFIFAVLAEETGFVGCLLVIGLFALLGWCGMRIGYRARERDGVASLVAYGLTIVILVQALLNIGGVLQVLPLSGRPLPFISSGGSSIVATLIMVGVLLGISDENERFESNRRATARRASHRDNLTVLDGGQRPPVRRTGGGAAPARPFDGPMERNRR